MDLSLNKEFEGLTQEEMELTDGGIGFIAGLVIGAVVTWAVDGLVTAYTGQSVSEWVATGINELRGK